MKAVSKKYNATNMVGVDSLSLSLSLSLANSLTLLLQTTEEQLPSGWAAGETDALPNNNEKLKKKPNNKKNSKKDLGFGGFSDDHYAECYPGYDTL